MFDIIHISNFVKWWRKFEYLIAETIPNWNQEDKMEEEMFLAERHFQYDEYFLFVAENWERIVSKSSSKNLTEFDAQELVWQNKPLQYGRVQGQSKRT